MMHRTLIVACHLGAKPTTFSRKAKKVSIARQRTRPPPTFETDLEAKVDHIAKAALQSDDAEITSEALTRLGYDVS